MGWSVYIFNIIDEENIAENTAQLQELHHQCRSHHAVVGLGVLLGPFGHPSCLVEEKQNNIALSYLLMNNCL